MAHDVFLSFASEDESRVRMLVDALRGQGISVFWSVDISIGSPDFQAIIATQIAAAAVVLVAWTHAAVRSHAVAQECAQAVRHGKLLQAVLDDSIDPISYPMEAQFRAEKAMLIGWNGDRRHLEWQSLLAVVCDRIDGVVRERSVHADDLTRICGIPAAIAEKLRTLGVLTFADIARWTPVETDRIASELGLSGIIERQNWVGQSRQLASGRETRFSQRAPARETMDTG